MSGKIVCPNLTLIILLTFLKLGVQLSMFNKLLPIVLKSFLTAIFVDGSHFLNQNLLKFIYSSDVILAASET